MIVCGDYTSCHTVKLATVPVPEKVWLVGDQIFWDIQGK